MRLLVFLLILAAAVLGSWLLWGGGWESRFTQDGGVRWLEQAGPWGWLAGFLLLVGDLVLPIPSTLVISALGYVYGTALGGLVASAGLIAAGLTGYGVGRLCGEKTARRWLGHRDFDKGHALFTRGGGWLVAVSRALPILPEVISCTAGLVRMPFRHFLTSLACGSLPMGFVFAWIGRSGRDQPGLAIGLSLALPALFWGLASWLRRNRSIRS